MTVMPMIVMGAPITIIGITVISFEPCISNVSEKCNCNDRNGRNQFLLSTIENLYLSTSIVQKQKGDFFHPTILGKDRIRST
jgi:hypothetical protein